MIRAFNGKTPKIAESAFVSEWAYVVGNVEIGENTGIWPGSVIRGDFGKIKIGSDCQIEDNAVIHCGTDMEIGDNVIIGHGAVIHGQKIGSQVLIGNNSTVLDFAEIGNSCIIAANSMVGSGQKIPDNSLAAGVPAKVQSELSSENMDKTWQKIDEKYNPLMKAIGVNSYSELARKYKEEGL